MTSEEAKEIIFNQWQSFLENYIDYGGISEAYKMAIKALEQQPNEDCISREAVKELLKTEWVKYHIPMELDVNLSFVLNKINELPSVTPKAESEDKI